MSIAHARRPARARPRTGALTRAQRAELEAELRRERARLERSLVGGSSSDPLAGGAAADTGDGTRLVDAGTGLVSTCESQAPARHAAIVAALDRLARGDYGRCATCGERIPYGRLLVMPEAERCIACGPGL